MREEAPLVRSAQRNSPVWLVTRYAEARRILNGPGISTSPETPGHPDHTFTEEDPPPELKDHMEKFRAGHFINMDPPEHTRFRRLLIPEFTVRRIRTMRPGIQRLVDDLIDDMLSQGEADLVEAFGLALPSLVICQLLGIPYADHEFFQSRTRLMVATGTDRRAGLIAVAEISEYLDHLVTKAEAAPKDDLLGRLIQGGVLTHDELVGVIFLLLVAGHETTANMIPLSALTLLKHPEQLAALRENPERWPDAVEELLRFHSIVDWAAFDRMALEDIDFGGQRIRAGEVLFVLAASANRDETAFERPDEFDIHRPGRRHVAFGYGIHQCLGQNLARTEIDIALRTLLERVPTLALDAPVSELPFKYNTAIFGLQALPVRW
jgi:cytochrome P450 monooxygenase